ncbi:MAG TPA: metal-sensitive transcriptional regulator [Anaerolineae bacterium]|nr:metal-sensitive transcriptional regulator [Anaerolineae bacterium]
MPTKATRTPARASTQSTDEATRADILKRLRRIEGQVRGIQRMIEQDRGCCDVLDQLSAVQQAVRGVSGLVAQEYAVECIGRVQESTSEEETKETAAALVNAILRAPR